MKLTTICMMAAVCAVALAQAPKPGVIVGGGGGGGGSVTAGTGINVTGSTVSIDTAVTASRDIAASGIDTFCSDSTGSTTTKTCNMTANTGPGSSSGNALVAYTEGMMIRLRSTSTVSGTPTLNINGLGARNMYEADGTTLMNSYTAGQDQPMVYQASLNGGAGGFKKVVGGGSGVTPLFQTFTIPNDASATDYSTALTRSVIDGYPVFTSSITGGGSQGRLFSEGTTFDRRFSMFLEYGAGGDGHAGVMMADASGRAFVCGYRYNNSTSALIAGLEFFAFNLANSTTYTAAVSAASPMTNFQYRGRVLLTPMYFRTIRDATNLRCQTSPNGVIWIDFATQTVANFTAAVGGTGPTLTGIWIREAGSAASTRLYWTGYQ